MGIRVKSLPNAAGVFKKRSAAAYRDHKRRAARYGYTLPYTLAELREYVRERLDGHPGCRYCGVLLTDADFCLDHVRSVGRVVDARTWTLSNLNVACKTCNEIKGRLHGGEFKDLMAVVNTLSPQAQADIRGRLRAGAARCAGKR